MYMTNESESTITSNIVSEDINSEYQSVYFNHLKIEVLKKLNIEEETERDSLSYCHKIRYAIAIAINSNLELDLRNIPSDLHEITIDFYGKAKYVLRAWIINNLEDTAYVIENIEGVIKNTLASFTPQLLTSHLDKIYFDPCYEPIPDKDYESDGSEGSIDLHAEESELEDDELIESETNVLNFYLYREVLINVCEFYHEKGVLVLKEDVGEVNINETLCHYTQGESACIIYGPSDVIEDKIKAVDTIKEEIREATVNIKIIADNWAINGLADIRDLEKMPRQFHKIALDYYISLLDPVSLPNIEAEYNVQDKTILETSISRRLLTHSQIDTDIDKNEKSTCVSSVTEKPSIIEPKKDRFSSACDLFHSFLIEGSTYSNHILITNDKKQAILQLDFFKNATHDQVCCTEEKIKLLYVMIQAFIKFAVAYLNNKIARKTNNESNESYLTFIISFKNHLSEISKLLDKDDTHYHKMHKTFSTLIQAANKKEATLKKENNDLVLAIGEVQSRENRKKNKNKKQRKKRALAKDKKRQIQKQLKDNNESSEITKPVISDVNPESEVKSKLNSKEKTVQSSLQDTDFHLAQKSQSDTKVLDYSGSFFKRNLDYLPSRLRENDIDALEKHYINLFNNNLENGNMDCVDALNYLIDFNLGFYNTYISMYSFSHPLANEQECLYYLNDPSIAATAKFKRETKIKPYLLEEGNHLSIKIGKAIYYYKSIKLFQDIYNERMLNSLCEEITLTP